MATRRSRSDCLLYPNNPTHTNDPSVLIPHDGSTRRRVACTVCGRYSASAVVASMIKGWAAHDRAQVSRWLADRNARPPHDASGAPIPGDAFPDIELWRKYLWQYAPVSRPPASV